MIIVDNLSNYLLMSAIKLTQHSAKAEQLSVFIQSLVGQSKTIDLYKYKDLTYVNIDILLPILSVEKKWFLSNSESPLHRIKIAGNDYVNKYGITKLLGQSKQKAALRLQDYLYELFYEVETKGTVSKDDLSSRDELISTLEELNKYKILETDRIQMFMEKKKEADAMRNDVIALEQEIIALKEKISSLEEDNQALQDEVDLYKPAAIKLAKYVRIKSKAPPKEAHDLAEDDDDDLPDEKEVLDAKQLIKNPPKKRQVTITTPLTQVDYYIMRSSDTHHDTSYKWAITDNPPSNELKQMSREIINNYASTSLDMIFYKKVSLTQDAKKILSILLDMNDGILEESIIADI